MDCINIGLTFKQGQYTLSLCPVNVFRERTYA